MFNSYSNSTPVNISGGNINIQACPGGIYKSHPNSRIIRFAITSELAQNLLSVEEEKHYYSFTGIDKKTGKMEYDKKVYVVVLQVVNFGDWCLAEIMDKDDYDEALIVYDNGQKPYKEEKTE